MASIQREYSALLLKDNKIDLSFCAARRGCYENFRPIKLPYIPYSQSVESPYITNSWSVEQAAIFKTKITCYGFFLISGSLNFFSLEKLS